MKTAQKTQMVHNAFHLEIDKNSIVNDGEGVLRFPNGLVLTDSSEQWNGTRYDIDSLDINQYQKRMFADHEYGVRSIVGNMLNVYKRGNQIVTDGVRFAVNENPTARLVYDLILGGFLDSVSIGTQGPMPDEDGIYRDHAMMEVSWVGLPNNKNATINQVENLIEIATKNGLDPTNYELNRREDTMHKIKNSRDFAVTLKFKNESDEEVEKTVAPGEEVEVPESQKESVEKQVEDAEAPKKAEDDTAQNGMTKEDLKLISDVKNELAELRKFKEQHSATNANEPTFNTNGNGGGTTSVSAMQNNSKITDKIKNMSAGERLQRQANLAFRNQLWNPEYHAINDFNKEEIVKHKDDLAKLDKDIAKNVVTMADDSFGGLVPSYELLSEIVGCRTSYDSLLDVFSFTNTDRLQYAWNLRVGDINMQPVDFCDDGTDGNRKPISEYGLNQEVRSLEELAAVTPVCNAATLFTVGDLLNDIAMGYQNDQRRKFAQLIVAALEQAVETNVAGKATGGVPITANPDASVVATTNKEWRGILQAITEVSECAPNGVLIMSTGTAAVIQAAAIDAGVQNGGFVDLYLNDGARVTSLLGHRVVTVPNELLPKLGTNETRTFVINGTTVTVNHAIFYVEPQNWRGITHNTGLQYDLSRDASYEVNTGTAQAPVWVTRSAYQRNELVLRGSFFRGGGVKDFRLVTGIQAATTAES